ncbi:MAG TPA: substrate-binding domain-containing protein, partial [Ktedonobacteraceae bacterium]|nr:substrate-binding domain-containing protein [Ktedonobacteraceae bacterium]
QLLNPPLTTVVIPALEMGRRAMELLLASLGTERQPFAETLPLDFVIRASTASPREKFAQN